MKLLLSWFRKNEGATFFSSLAVYLAVVFILANVITKEVSSGIAYIKHRGLIALNSGNAYFALGMQIFFMVLATVICTVKVKRNMEH